jgi:hypothetical protein
MQGKFIILTLLSTLAATPALAGEAPRRQTCQRVEAPQQRQQQVQQQQRRNRPQGCPVVRTIPAVVDPTPIFLL